MKLVLGTLLLGVFASHSAQAACAASKPRCVKAKFVEKMPDDVKYSDRFDAECVGKLKIMQGKQKGKVLETAVHGLKGCPQPGKILRGSLEPMCNDTLGGPKFLDSRLRVPGEACAKK